MFFFLTEEMDFSKLTLHQAKRLEVESQVWHFQIPVLNLVLTQISVPVLDVKTNNR